MARLSVISLADWAKADVDEIREKWMKRRREIEEIERKKTEKEKRIEEKKEEKRRREIRERRCFVCGIFGHMAHYCRNREEKKGPAQVPLNRFEVLRDRVMQRGEGSGKGIGRDRRKILREERMKKIGEKKKVQVQMPDKDKKEKKEVEEKKEEKMIEKEEKTEIEKIEMRGFSRGEILRGRYSLEEWKGWCYECGGVGHRKRDHEKIKKDKKIEKDIRKEKIEKD